MRVESLVLAGFKVLVADDNRDAAESMGILLSMCGYSVLVAHSGARRSVSPCESGRTR
jgi:CheY-like chemotaxis protein